MPTVVDRRAILWGIVIFLVGLAVRMAYVRHYGIQVQEGGDAEEYMALARHLSQGHGFTSDGLTPSTYRPPLFSWLLGAWCHFLGSTTLATMIGFQVLVQAACASLTYVLARLIQPSVRFAVVGGLFVATYPFIVTSVDLVLQEPIQMLVATAIGIAVTLWLGRPTMGGAAVAGLLFGLGALAKVPFLFAPAIVVLVYALDGRLRRQIPARQIVLACVLTAVVVLPWTLRNSIVTGGRFILINSQNVTFPIWLVADGNFYPRETLSELPRGNPALKKGVALTYGNQDGVDFLNRRNDELLHEGVSGPALVENLAAASREYLFRHPGYLLKITVRGAVLLFSPDAGRRLSPYLKVRIAAMLLFHVPLAAGLILGLLRALREKNPTLIILSLFTAFYLIPHAPPTMGGGRYSIPVLPLLIAISGFGAWGARSPGGPVSAPPIQTRG